MRFQLIPSRQGQICRQIGSSSVYNDDVYIFVGTTGNDSVTEFVKLNDLQRNISNPELACKYNIPVSEFTVLADSLEKYVRSWNSELPPVGLKAYIISELDDVKQFFYDLHQILSVEFYSDDDFCLLTDANDFSIFTEPEGMYLNQVMINCFNICDKAGVDIYDLAGEAQIAVWRRCGVWPK